MDQYRLRQIVESFGLCECHITGIHIKQFELTLRENQFANTYSYIAAGYQHQSQDVIDSL
jgi:hypothetical protein